MFKFIREQNFMLKYFVFCVLDFIVLKLAYAAIGPNSSVESLSPVEFWLTRLLILPLFLFPFLFLVWVLEILRNPKSSKNLMNVLKFLGNF